MTKAWLIATRLLWQNRWLFLLLMLWPYIMAAILCFGGQPDPDDVLWILHQECFAGLALVAVTGSTLLGNEQRSRRIIMVLSRAVSRPQYLLSLLITAWLPLVLYVSGFLISGIFMANLLVNPSATDRRLYCLRGVYWSRRLPRRTALDRPWKTPFGPLSNIYFRK